MFVKVHQSMPSLTSISSSSSAVPALQTIQNPATPAPMTPMTPASADPGIVPQLQYVNSDCIHFSYTSIFVKFLEI